MNVNSRVYSLPVHVHKSKVFIKTTLRMI